MSQVESEGFSLAPTTTQTVVTSLTQEISFTETGDNQATAISSLPQYFSFPEIKVLVSPEMAVTKSLT